MRALLALSLLFVTGCARPGGELTVGAAVSLREALIPVVAELERASGVQVRIHYGASGTIANQVERGAQIDVVLSAGVEEIERLAARGRIAPGTQRVFAANRLVLVQRTSARPLRLADLPASEGRIAVGQPAMVPAGRYAIALLDRMGLTKRLAGRLLYAGSVRQALEYVERGEAVAALVYATDVRGRPRARITDEPAVALQPPIRYIAAVVAGSPRSELAARFLALLDGPSGQRALAAAGFLRASGSPRP